VKATTAGEIPLVWAPNERASVMSPADALFPLEAQEELL
jgi:hypothetical protein